MIKIKVWGDITEKTTSIVESAVASLINEEEPVLVVINSNGGTINEFNKKDYKMAYDITHIINTAYLRFHI